MESYTDKPAPEELKRDIRNTEIDLAAQQGLREAKRKEAAAINAKYDEDRQRFVELTQPNKDQQKN